MVNEQMQFFLRGFRRDAHPMAVMTGLVGALSAFYHDSTDINNPEHREIAAIRLIAKMPTLVAMAYKYGVGQPYIYPKNDLSYAGNFMRMMFATPCEDYEPNPVLVRAIDRIFILHADHEQNASTSTVRLCGSSGTNPFAAIAAGVACLWGPAHGGANEACLNMLEDIQRNGWRGQDRRVHQPGQGQELRRQADGLRPPRLQELRPARQADARDLPRGAGRARPAERPAVQAGHGAREDRAGRRVLRARKLYPNVDFYSGIVQRAIGIPVSLFTGIFALARTVGWIAQLNEMIGDPEYKIGRPRQLFAGCFTVMPGAST
jgi:citrate synthase